MKYIAAIDYEHLDNGVFLATLAHSISQQHQTQPIIVHGDSPYTGRIMQNGVMREEAKIRSIKDLNKRLIALFADEGVSAVGINGYQRQLITQEDEELSINTSFFNKLAAGPALIISTLVWDLDGKKPLPISLTRMVRFLHEKFAADAMYAFSSAGKDEIIITKKPELLRWKNLTEDFANKNLPQEFHHFNRPLRLSTARDFSQLTESNSSVIIQ